ncbi:MAG: 30S ribosomal protein S21 [Saprospiraceae bacterium]|nr:30S ribosomal protein S21 [Bacteroidia bacterium]NNF20480.1 30S ribosomal protein S21 [Saprospiraceae bacterium]
MIIIDRKDTESIDRMVKRYKRKHRNVKLIKEIRQRKRYTKKSVERRNEILDAKYRFEKFG